jgi:hypothetical protein
VSEGPQVCVLSKLAYICNSIANKLQTWGSAMVMEPLPGSSRQSSAYYQVGFQGLDNGIPLPYAGIQVKALCRSKSCVLP